MNIMALLLIPQFIYSVFDLRSGVRTRGQGVYGRATVLVQIKEDHATPSKRSDFKFKWCTVRINGSASMLNLNIGLLINHFKVRKNDGGFDL